MSFAIMETEKIICTIRKALHPGVLALLGSGEVVWDGRRVPKGKREEEEK